MAQKETEIVSQKPPISSRHFESQNKQTNKKFLTMFNFQHSQINQQEFEQLAELLLKYPMIFTTPKFDVGKLVSTLHLPLKTDAVFK